MPSLPLLLVDAFTDRPFTGNACAVVLDAGGLSREVMQAIAREMNQSETAFVLGGSGTRFDVRYYTPGEEIPLAGHPTIATTAALADAKRLLPTGVRTEVTFVLRDGPISIAYEKPGSAQARVVMTQRRPEFRQTLDRAAVASIFGLGPSDLRTDAPVQVVSTGTPQLMIPVASLDALRRARLDVPHYVVLRGKESFFSVHLFVLEGATPRGRTFARHFGVPPDHTEDPVTGSATGGMGAYLFHHQLVRERDFVAEQGHWMGRPGLVEVHLEGTPEDVRSVSVGGPAVVVARGTLEVPG
ncbi:MAG TPA: PhzF family phenazine biosynthesis protein [Myxococcaceae bacterium]|nr:PhzF family phenazine biosynthesis protein [Myxococcaceae bacterium]